MRSHSYCSACHTPPSIQSKDDTKCSPRVSRYSSGEGMPCSFANAKAVFFWVSVATTSALSPTRYESTSAAPRSCEVTFRSMISCRAVSRTIRTTLFSALPYLLAPSETLTSAMRFSYR